MGCSSSSCQQQQYKPPWTREECFKFVATKQPKDRGKCCLQIEDCNCWNDESIANEILESCPKLFDKDYDCSNGERGDGRLFVSSLKETNESRPTALLSSIGLSLTFSLLALIIIMLSKQLIKIRKQFSSEHS